MLCILSAFVHNTPYAFVSRQDRYFNAHKYEISLKISGFLNHVTLKNNNSKRGLPESCFRKNGVYGCPYFTFLVYIYICKNRFADSIKVGIPVMVLLKEEESTLKLTTLS